MGIFIDGIQVSNSNWIQSLEATNLPSTAKSVNLNSATAGEPLITGNTYILRLRARINNHWFPYGNSLSVTPVAESSLSGYEAWKRSYYDYIGDSNHDYDSDGVPNSIEYVFGLNPSNTADASSVMNTEIINGNFQISHPILPNETIQAEYSHTLTSGSWQSVTVSISNGVATASIPVTSSPCFLRWKSDP